MYESIEFSLPPASTHTHTHTHNTKQIHTHTHHRIQKGPKRTGNVPAPREVPIQPVSKRRHGKQDGRCHVRFFAVKEDHHGGNRQAPHIGEIVGQFVPRQAGKGRSEQTGWGLFGPQAGIAFPARRREFQDQLGFRVLWLLHRLWIVAVLVVTATSSTAVGRRCCRGWRLFRVLATFVVAVVVVVGRRRRSPAEQQQSGSL